MVFSGYSAQWCIRMTSGSKGFVYSPEILIFRISDNNNNNNEKIYIDAERFSSSNNGVVSFRLVSLQSV